MAQPTSKTETNFKFEQAMADIEGLVSSLEKGDMPLDKALDAFEKGVLLVKQCQQKLQTAELRVEKILADPNGKATKTESFTN